MSENRKNNMQAWIPFMSKMIWPIFVGIFFALYHGEIHEIVSISVERIKSGSEFEIAGVFTLGQAAQDTQIGNIAPANINIEAVGGPAGAVRKGSPEFLERLQADLEANPSLAIDTLLLVDGVTLSTELIKQYISSLSLRYIIFTSGGEFDGWINANVLVAQLPPDQDLVSYSELREIVVGVRDEVVTSNASARDVLLQMQDLHVDSLPVLDENGNWQFFVNQGQIISRLMTGLLIDAETES